MQSNAPPAQSLSMHVDFAAVDQAQACWGSDNCDSVIYIFNMTVTNTGSQNYAFDDFDLRLKTDTGNSYMAYPIVYAIQHPASGHPHQLASPVDLAPGQSTIGEEGFKIPSSETPQTLVYSDWAVSASASIPKATSWVSEVFTVGEASISPAYLSCSDPGNDQVQSCYTAGFGGMNSSLLGSTDYFTGEVMAFKVTISLGKGPSPGPTPGTVAVHSTISSFFVVHVTAPECVGSDSTGCTSWTVEVYLVPQPGISYYGSPDLTVDLPPV